MGTFRCLAIAVIAVPVAVVALPRYVGAEDTPGGYNPITAGQDAWQYHEQRRLEDVARQVRLNEMLRWRYAAVRDPYNRLINYWPDIEAVYATGYRGSYARYAYRYWGHRVPVYEPCPLVPGNILGYPYFNPVPQPIGQRHVQTGPNRWESHPVFAPTKPGEDIQRPGGVRPGEPPEPAVRTSGPREF